MEFGVYFLAAPETFSSLPTQQLLRRNFGVSPAFRGSTPGSKDSRFTVFDVAATGRAFGWKARQNWDTLFAEVLAEAATPNSTS